MSEIRLQKFLSDNGVCSRRKAEEYILNGKVKVNDRVIIELGTKVNTLSDIVKFDNKIINNIEEKIYILLNKPIGYVTTVNDQFGRETVIALLDLKQRVVPVGRLDMYTSGALLLSNDGEFVYKITHPKHEITKTYNVTLSGIITKQEIDKLCNGVEIDGYITKEASIRILKIDKEKNISRIEITIHEGKNRQIRKMCDAIGKKVMGLHRTKISNLSVKDLKLGQYRKLSKKEVESLIN